MAELAVHARGLVKHFGPVKAVDGVDLSITRGQVYGLLGPNGAGKTTTIHLLLGLARPTAGVARVAGFDAVAQGDDVRAHVGALLEHAGVYERLSAIQNLHYFGRINRMASAEVEGRAKEILEGVGLWERRNDLVGTWSKGMKQKLAIARCLIHRPQIVFLDEPTAGHDPRSAKELRDDVRRLVKTEGTTFFLSTHNLTEAESVCDRVAILQKGRIVAEGAPADLRAGQGRHELVVIGTGWKPAILSKLRKLPQVVAVAAEDGALRFQLRKGAPAAPIVEALVRGGAAVEEVRRETASLEDAYLDLTRDDR